MAISKEIFVEVVSTAVESMRKDIKADLQEYVEGAIESHRRAVWVKNTWCCPDMQTFAAHVWLLPNPPNREAEFFGGVSLSIRGSVVNYCPFCGVRVGAK